ncbi:hypothetical protein N566_08360 [Streptomycetaceae bacterium MP113-05]|nr:hypothetical protein N566_08360 [Streptomycetaceae bacterium MP113-05]
MTRWLDGLPPTAIPAAVGALILLGVAVWVTARRRDPHSGDDVRPLKTEPGRRR